MLVKGLVRVIPMLVCAEARAERDDVSNEAHKGGSRAEVVYRAQTRYDFDDDLVEGSLVRPEDELVTVGKGAVYESLIKVREDFLPEMLKTADDL